MARPEDTRLPSSNVVEVWPLSLEGRVAGHLDLLSRHELARFNRRLGDDARRFALAHGRMREVLSTYLACPPRAVPLSARHAEPPAVVGLCLSLSHSQDLALLAVSRSPVGVDVESTENAPVEELGELAELTLSQRERTALGEVSAAERARMWLRLWSRREAVLKARPDALAKRAIGELDVLEDSVLDITVEDLELGEGYVGALAHSPTAPEIVIKGVRR